VDEFRGNPDNDNNGSSNAQKNPFTAGKSGPPVFYRSKNAPADDSQRETEAPRVSNPLPQAVQSK